MGFLRRLLGGGRADPAAPDGETEPDEASLDADERARELELARFDQDRADDLVRRQQRFSSYSWTPPAQGGERRAEDNDESSGP